ncbi:MULTISPECIES: glycosyltransferase 87 family protein [Gordonia]|uniref:glycosyltransferase 87 family protein n=1 Tax=Gordonia TaxID=2053 RepID=UPI00257FF637|nr:MULTISPECIES: glycosyltransferase 87 family protein [Gordonia]
MVRASRRWVVAVGFLLVAAVAVWLQDVIVPFTTPFWGLFDNQLDLDVYRAGTQTVLDGGSLYDAKLLGQMDYTYAPISAIIFIPFALMSFEVARIVWTAGIFVALYLVIMLCFRSLGRQATWPLRIIALSLIAVALLLEPVRTTVWYGQINVFLLLIILADLLRAERPKGDNSRGMGIGTGIAAGIKLTPLIFILYLAILRRWRAMFGVIAGFVGTIVVGFIVLPSESWAYWTDKLFDSNRVGAPQTVGNQSIRGWLANLIHTDAPNSLLWGVLALAALALGMYAAVLAHRHGQELLALSLVGMTACAISPMSWGHHWVWFVPILVICVNLILRVDLSPLCRTLAGAACAGLILVSFSWRTYLAHPIWFVNKTVPDAYLIGLFFKHGISWLEWFTVYPYNAVFLCTTIATIVIYRRPRVSVVPDPDHVRDTIG